MAYIILGDIFTFPDGDAATNRVYTYARGFIENGKQVHVICFRSDYEAEGDGITESIHYYHPFGRKKRSKYFLIRVWFKILKYFKTIRIIGAIHRNNGVEVIHCYTRIIPTQLFAYLLSRRFNSKITLERSEHPMRFHQGSLSKKLIGNLNIFLEARLSDYIFCISQYLVDFYKSKAVKSSKIFLVPSTVDTTRFGRSYPPPLNYKYIGYCGSLTLEKDGVDILIKSFSGISDNFPGINLVLIGKSDTLQEEMTLKDLVVKLNISERVLFLGKIPRNEVPAYLTNAMILALARPKSMVADAGFPSKLTEYLATGNPVVVTKVGEIPLYLNDNEHAFLSEPDSAEAFSQRLEAALSNYEFARKIGENGKKLTETIFNYNYQARRIIKHIDLQ